ncbi:MAG: hypothetical protein ACR2PZ_11665 [Pseudomonadales bacterium]
MKIAFTIFLVLNLLTELLAAASLIGGPMGISASGEAAAGGWAMHYGFAVIAIASTLFWLWPYRSSLSAVTAVLGMLLTFHICLFISLSIAGDQQAGVIIHAVLAVFSVILFSQRKKWCSLEDPAAVSLPR